MLYVICSFFRSHVISIVLLIFWYLLCFLRRRTVITCVIFLGFSFCNILSVPITFAYIRIKYRTDKLFNKKYVLLSSFSNLIMTVLKSHLSPNQLLSVDVSYTLFRFGSLHWYPLYPIPYIRLDKSFFPTQTILLPLVKIN